MPEGADEETRALVETLYRDGVVAEEGASTPAWADAVREDVEAALAEALSRPDGAVGRGPDRCCVEIHPEQLRGFADHPWVRRVPGPGAVDQPWHHDVPMREETRRTGRLTSLAFDLTGVDTAEDTGPFEVAPAPRSTCPTAATTARSRRGRCTGASRSARCARTRSAVTSRRARR